MFELNIGLLWYNVTQGNLGVVALTNANIGIVLSAVEKVRLKARGFILKTGSAVPDGIVKSYSKRGHLTQNRSIRWLQSQFIQIIIKKCDFVFDIGEGDSFSVISGIKFSIPRRTLLKRMERWFLHGKEY